MNPPQALLFDLDGTLLDGGGNAEAIARTCEAIASATDGLDAARLQKADREAFAAVWPEIEQDWILGRIQDPGVNFQAWRRALATCGFNDEALVSAAAEMHWQLHIESLVLYGDAAQLLARLPNHLPLAVITNGASGRQRGALRGNGIEERFCAVIVSGEIGVAKPDAKVFNLALDGLGVKAENAWHVGDNLMADIGGANAAGITSVWINRYRDQGVELRDGDPRPDFEITSLVELPALMAPQT